VHQPTGTISLLAENLVSLSGMRRELSAQE